MPHLRRIAAAGLALVAACLALAAFPSGTAGAAWRWPVRGEVVGEFAFSPRAPFAAGARRGMDIAARAGELVGAACSGRVTFTGRLPDGLVTALPRAAVPRRATVLLRAAGRETTRGVTVRCGRLAATHLGLARVLVRRGARVAAGATLGTAGHAGAVRLGARVAARRFGYVDPRSLLGSDPSPSDGPGAIGAAPRDSPPGLAPAPAPPRPSPHRAPAIRLVPDRGPHARPAPHGFPALGWAGLALVATGLPLGGIVRLRRRRRPGRMGTDPASYRHPIQGRIGSGEPRA